MDTVLAIVGEAGGLDKSGFLNIENPPFMRLVIEVLPERGPDGHRVVSIAHYGELNSDAMRDPEICAEVVENGTGEFELWPFYFRNNYVGIGERSRWRDGGDLVCLPLKTSELRAVMKLSDSNLRAQGFWMLSGAHRFAREPRYDVPDSLANRTEPRERPGKTSGDLATGLLFRLRRMLERDQPLAIGRHGRKR